VAEAAASSAPAPGPAAGKTGPILLGAGAVAVVGVALWLALAGPPEAEAGGRPPYVLPVTLGEVEVRDVVPRTSLTGTVRSARRTRLGFEVAGVVSALAVREADRVAAGQVLARLDARDLALELEARQSERLQAERELERLQAGARAEEVARLRAELEVARADEALAVLELDRGRVLVERKVISPADLDRLEAAVDAAAGRTAAAAQRLAEAEAGTRIEDIRVAEARLKRAADAVRIAELELAKTAVRAPWGGAVVERRASVGDYVEAGATVYELVDPDELEVFVEVPSRYAARVGDRSAVRITLDDVPGFALEADLTAKLPAADAVSRNFTGIVRLPRGETGGGLLKPGMFVRLDVEMEPVTGRLVVPRDAVRITAKGPVLVRAVDAPQGTEPGQSPSGLVGEWVPVRLLGADARGQAVEPLGDASLAAGDRVVVTGVDLAFPGVPLAPQPPPDAGAAPAPGGAQ